MKKEKMIEKTINYFKTQVSVDLEKHRNSTTKSFDSSKMLIVDWSSMTRKDQILIQQASLAYGGRYQIVDQGVWMKGIISI